MILFVLFWVLMSLVYLLAVAGCLVLLVGLAWVVVFCLLVVRCLRLWFVWF